MTTDQTNRIDIDIDTDTDTHRRHGGRSPRFAGLVAHVRDDLRTRRAERAGRRRLEADLASYRTAAEQDDLLAMLDRYEDADVREIRTILARHRAA
jgi:hypothetical protein